MAFDAITAHCFIAVAETGSFTQAAQRVGRSQSAVSQQVAKLEDLLGKALLVRGKQITLTREGEIFLQYARQIFALQREVIDRLREPDLQGEVRFGLPEDFASVFLSDVLVEFGRIHPRVMLNIECDLTLNLFERFKHKEFDLVLVKMSRPEDFPNGHEVWSESLEWVGKPELVQGEAPLPLVLSPEPCVYRARALHALTRARVPWRLAFSSTSYAGTLAAVKAGLGITVLPGLMIPKEYATIDPGLLPPLTDTHISLLKHDTDNAAVTSFEQFVLEHLRH